MQILVVSDSHGNNYDIKALIERMGKIDMLIHLGDVGRQSEYIQNLVSCPVYMIAGNNDFGRDLPNSIEFMIGTYKIFITHGHRFHVSFGVDKLRRYAIEKGYDVVMYGHTHMPFLEIGNAVTILNPGSISYPRQNNRQKSYMLMELDEEGMLHYSQAFLSNGSNL